MHILQNFESKSDEKMKPLLCILASVLLSVSVWAQESKPLTYITEFDVPGWTAEELFYHYREWVLQDPEFVREHFGWTRYDSNFASNVFFISGSIWDFKMEDKTFAFSYSVSYCLRISCSDGNVELELSDIQAWEGKDEIWDWQQYGSLTQGPEGVRRGLYGWWWRSCDRKVRAWLESWFDEISGILYEAAASADRKLDSRRTDPALRFFFGSGEAPVTI